MLNCILRATIPDYQKRDGNGVAVGKPRKISIKDYFFEKHGRRLMFPSMPLIEKSPKSLLPIELVKIVVFWSIYDYTVLL